MAIRYSHDINGNRQTKTVGGVTDSYTWDVNDRLVRVDRNGAQVFNASYDYRTRRATKSEKKDDALKTTVFRYDQGDSFQEFEGEAKKVEFVRGSGMGGGIGSILYSERASTDGGEEFFHFNAVGHTVATSTVDGTVKSSNLYEAYGGIVLSTGSSENNRLANTKERDFSIGLDNHGRRYFDPEVGRYINMDPIGYGDGPNVYIYVHNNPINFIDPLGLGNEEEWDWHHDAAREVFEGKEGKASYVSEKGLSLEEGIDINSPEYGRMVKRYDHTGKGGIHPEGWNAAWKDKVDDWARAAKSGGSKTITRNMLHSAIKDLYGMEEFKGAFLASRGAVMHYGTWKDITKRQAVYAALEAEEGLRDFAHLQKGGKAWGDLKLLRGARNLASKIGNIAKPLGIGFSAYLAYSILHESGDVNAASYAVFNENFMGVPDAIGEGARELNAEFNRVSSRAAAPVRGNLNKEMDMVGVGKVKQRNDEGYSGTYSSYYGVSGRDISRKFDSFMGWALSLGAGSDEKK